MLRSIVVFVFLALVSLPAMAAEEMKDVPKDHWAADSVQRLADAGIVKGYPDGEFKGDKLVTRFEFAAALERFVEFFQQSLKPVIPNKESKPTAASPKPPADKSMAFLKDGGFLPKDSPILKDGNKPITTDQMAEALAMVTKKMIEMRVPGFEDEEKAKKEL